MIDNCIEGNFSFGQGLATQLLKAKHKRLTGLCCEMICAVLLTSLFYLRSAQTQQTTIWTETFTSAVVSTTCQCQKWLDFWQLWIGDPSQVVSIILGGSLTSTTYKCSGSAAQFIAFALAAPPYETTQVTCESGIWYTGHGAVTGQLTAVGVMTPPTACSSNPAIRPCWADICWGGIGSVTCAPTQTLKVTVVSNIPTVTVPPASVTWTESFKYLIPATSTQCANWKQFWKNNRSGSLSVTLKSTFSPGFIANCSGPGVNMLATGLFTATSNGQYHCNEGTVWYFNDLYPGLPSTSAISVGNNPLNCDANWALRPCWDQPNIYANWGGFGNNTCSAASQTFTATVAIGTNTITNACWKQVNVEITTGIFTISCNTIMLQCNTNYTASGYGSNTLGQYNCTNSVWIPVVPSCTGVSATTVTGSTTTTKTNTPLITSTVTTTTNTITSSTSRTTSATLTNTSNPTMTTTTTSPTVTSTTGSIFLSHFSAISTCLMLASGGF